jgi:ubiquinone/menaquinone biosynthesis C-methylase UbiE
MAFSPRQNKRNSASSRQFAKPAAHTSWNRVANWYSNHLSTGGTYQDKTIFPGALRLLAPEANKRYLDIACGEGSFLRLVGSEQPASDLYGIDAAPDLIAHAETLRKKDQRFHFSVADAQRVSAVVAPKSIDGATCLMAIQNIEHMDSVFKETAKVLKPGASFVIVMNHPGFRAPQQSGWGWDETRKLQYRRMDRYLTPYAQPIIAHPGSAPSVKTLSYHRPLTSYVAALSAAGFVVDALEEWISDKVSDSGPRAKAENLARKEFPLFLAIRAKRT